MPSDSRPLMVGLYGAGAFGRFVVESLKASKIATVRAVASRTYTHAERLARDEEVGRVHSSLDALLGDRDVELVVVATPPSQHGPQALAALAAGKHVLIEKPLATEIDVAERVVEQARTQGLVATVDYPMLYNPLIEAVKLFNTSRLVGPLLHVRVDNIASSSGIDDSHWFWDRSLSGGIFVEHGVHFFDWCGRLAGKAHKVVALSAQQGVRENRVEATVLYGSATTVGAMGSYYHAFVARPETERTRSVLSYVDVDIVLDGWIPTSMHMQGAAAAVATTTIRRMLRREVESVPDARLGFLFSAGDKQVLYAEGVRAAVEDTVRAIREPGYVPRNAAKRALESTRVGVAAREAAATGSAIELGITKSGALS